MPSSFTTLWGSTLHGVQITWTNAIAEPEKLHMRYRAFYYWYMPHWYNSDSDEALNAAISSTGNNGKDNKSYVDGVGSFDDTAYLTGTSRDSLDFSVFI